MHILFKHVKFDMPLLYNGWHAIKVRRETANIIDDRAKGFVAGKVHVPNDTIVIVDDSMAEAHGLLEYRIEPWKAVRINIKK